MRSDPLLKWKLLGLMATFVLAGAVPAWLVRQHHSRVRDGEVISAPATFVGREACRPCHEKEFKEWLGSDHDRAMAPADATSVRGDFDDVTVTNKGVTSRFYRSGPRYMVHTQGPDGKMEDFEIRYTFGVEPLQQYLIAFPGGRLQCLNLAWDGDANRWFDVYPAETVFPPGDWLHWTGGGQTWNGMCAECHSTNLIKGFDPKTKSYNTSWSEIDVSCEACHGPGSEHLAWAKIHRWPVLSSKILAWWWLPATSSPPQRWRYARPVTRGAPSGDYYHTQRQMLDYLRPVLLEERLYHADGQILDEVYVWGSFTQSKMYAKDVRCSDCHNVHSGKHHQEGNALCVGCHRADAYDTKEHHFHKKIHKGQLSDGGLCVKCHMPETAYMVIDERADHSIRIPRPDLSAAIGTPNACRQKGCHDNETPAWVIDAFTKWYGQAKKPHYGPTLAAGRAGRPEARGDLARLAGDQLVPAIARATALSLLSRYGGDESARLFAQSLADAEGLVRYTAVGFVVARDPRELVELVAPLLFDPLKAVRMEAAVRLADAPEQLLKPYQQKALREGLTEYTEAMSHSLDFAHAGHNLGNLYSRLQQPAKAERYYRDAIAIDDLLYPAKVNLAILLNADGRNTEAEKLLRQVVEANPEQYEAAYSLGLLLAEMERYREAADYLARAAKGMPLHPGAQRNLRAIREYLSQAKREGR